MLFASSSDFQIVVMKFAAEGKNNTPSLLNSFCRYCRLFLFTLIVLCFNVSVSQNTEYFDTNNERYWGISKNSWGGLIGGGVLKFSNKICTGLQITNFIQDIKVDHCKNRTYIPQNLLKKHNLDFSSINKVTKNDINFLSKFDNLLADLIQENQQLYDEGRILLKNLTKKHAIIINIFILSGQTILNKIRNQKSNILFKKPRTNKLEKLYIIIKATVSVFLKR